MKNKTALTSVLQRKIIRLFFLALLVTATLFNTGTLEAAPFAYVANRDPFAGSVSVIDTANNTVVDTIPMPNSALELAITPDGTRAYVANGLADTVTVIDTTSNAVVGSPIALGNVAGTPEDIAITPDGKHAYVADSTAAGLVGIVVVLDTASNTVVGRIVTGCCAVSGVASTPDGKRVYATNVGFTFGPSTVSVIDTETNTVADTIIIGDNPGKIAITPDGTRAYVTQGGASKVIDTATNTVVASIPLYLPVAIAITPDGTRAYLTNIASDNVAVIDTASNTVIDTIAVGNAPQGIAITPDGKYAYVTNGSNNVSVIDITSNAVIGDPITVGNAPVGIAITPRFIPTLSVNDLVTFTPITSTYLTSADTSGCPAGVLGKFSFTAALTGQNGSPALSDLLVKVNTLTNGNLLENADGGPGGTGARLTVSQQGGFSDGLLRSGESVDVPFIICLQQRKSFTFLVDVLGVTH